MALRSKKRRGDEVLVYGREGELSRGGGEEGEGGGDLVLLGAEVAVLFAFLADN